MADETSYTIGELAEQAGVTPRTIRYYTAEGLLPRPDARGQYALYGSEHLLRLQLIGRLKAGYLPLSAIKARIEHLPLDQIRVLLAQGEHMPAPPDSAAEYVARVLAEAPPSYQLAEAPQRYQLAHDPGAARLAPQARLDAAGPSAQLATLSEEPAGQPLAAAAMPIAAPAHTAEATPQAEQWRRIVLAPGVELHVREPLSAGMRRAIDRLSAFGHSIFGREQA